MDQITDPIAFVAALSDAEQRRIFDNLAYQYSSKQQSAPANDYTAEEAGFYAAIVGAMRRCGSLRPTPIGRLIESRGVGVVQFREHAAALDDYITYGCGVKLDMMRRIVIREKVITCLIQYIAATRRDKEGNHPPPSAIDANEILRRFGNLPIAVESAFPHYCASRLLHLIAPPNSANGRFI